MRILAVVIATGLFLAFGGTDARAELAKSSVNELAKDAVGFIRDLSRQTLSVVSDGTLTTEQRITYYRALFAKGFDINTLSRVILGRHWRTASAQQRAAYIDAFEPYVINTYARRLAGMKTMQFEITGARALSERDILVGSVFMETETSQPTQVYWRVRGQAGFKILDIVVEGVSMAFTQRAEFASLIHNNGGDLDALVKVLRERSDPIGKGKRQALQPQN